jgi:hypothetical protein
MEVEPDVSKAGNSSNDSSVGGVQPPTKRDATDRREPTASGATGSQSG